MPTTFRRLLLNELVSGVTSSFLWFAITFWVYLETRSVVTTGIIGGAFTISSALFGPAFGTYVDRHRKKAAMVLTTTVSTVCFTAATVLYLAASNESLLRMTSPWFWVLVGTSLLGSVAGPMRSIAVATTVTLLVPEDRRDRANGMVGTVPLMTDGAGADAIGGWFGTGPDRGIALLFTLAGALGVAVTLLAWGSRSYRRLAANWPGDGSPPVGDEPDERVAPVAPLARDGEPAIAGEPG